MSTRKKKIMMTVGDLEKALSQYKNKNAEIWIRRNATNCDSSKPCKLKKIKGRVYLFPFFECGDQWTS